MIETERMLAETVAAELERRRGAGLYSGKFAPQFHSFGYEGRCALPSHFDCSYSYTLGYTAGALIASGHTALMSSVQNLQVRYCFAHQLCIMCSVSVATVVSVVVNT